MTTQYSPSTDPEKMYRKTSDIGTTHSLNMPPNPLPLNPAQLSMILGWDKIGEQCSKINWEQPDWFPRGFVTMLVGEAGIGKSFLLLRIAGCYTNGWDWIDGNPFSGEQGRVVWCEGESAQLLNHNRALELGLDLRKMLSLFEDPFIDFRFDDEHHRQRLSDLAARDDVKLIVIDSLSGIHLGDENSTEMNKIIKFFAELARNTGKSILISHHRKKRNPFDKGSINLDSIRGSSSIVQNTRMVWAVDQPDPKDNQKRLKVIKSNLGLLPDPIGFLITSKGIEYQPLNEKKSKRQIELAKEFLCDVLSSGSVLASEVENLAEQKSITKRTLDSAKGEIGVISNKSREVNGAWVWCLPKPPDSDE